MFERLVQTVLGQFLSKYFTEDSLAKNKIQNSTQLGVWSGYVSLRNLELKKEYINEKIRRKGLPFEIEHCSFRHVEITIPWAKLSNPIGSSSSRWGKKNKDAAVVVVVVDGIHVLARTSFDFDDMALKKESLKKRRRALSNPFQKLHDIPPSMSYTEALKKRLKEGLLQEVADKLHVHLRDVHIRLEDIESDPQNPYACGVTLESMHIQHDDEHEITDGVVAKMAQLNHLSLYWNALDYGDDLPVEHAVLFQTCHGDQVKLSENLDMCIARRASSTSTPSRPSYIPTHSYLLLPVDGTWHGRLSTHPADLSTNPAIDMVLTIDPVSSQIRDFQCVQFLTLLGEYRNHKYVSKHRRFRPLISVKEDPKAWWRYITRAIRYQMHDSFLRWSWTRFADAYNTRGRYMELYERYLLFRDSSHDLYALDSTESDMEDDIIINHSRHLNGAVAIPSEHHDANGSASEQDFAERGYNNGAGSNGNGVHDRSKTPLSDEETMELRALEDGWIGDLSVDAILLFRAVVNRRLGRTVNGASNDSVQSYWWTPTVENAVTDDSEARAEWEKLLSYLESHPSDKPSLDAVNADQVAVSLTIRFEELRLGLFSPLSATTGLSPLRQLHEKFLDLRVVDLRTSVSLMGDYESKKFQLSISDLVGTEIRADRSQHVMAHRPDNENKNDSEGDLEKRMTNEIVSEKDPLLVVSLAQRAHKSSGCDVELVVFADTVELVLTPECEWIGHVKDMMKQVTRLPKVADFWGGLSLAYVNSLALGRLGLVAKAQSVVDEHKSIDVEITIQCPVLHIGDGKGNQLIIDLGIAHIGTEKLAGVAGTHVNGFVANGIEEAALETSSIDQFVGRLDDTSEFAHGSGRNWTLQHSRETPTSARKREGRHFMFSSGLSVDSRTQGGVSTRSISGSINVEEPLLRMSVMDDGKKSEGNSWSSLFYDVFFFRLLTGKITLCGNFEQFDVSQGFAISTIIKKSVLPADHTLCKLKAHANIHSLTFELNERVIAVASNGLKTWIDLLRAGMDVGLTQLPKRGSVLQSSGVSSVASATPNSIGGDSASQIDDEEFFDANDMNDSFAGDNPTLWFDDNWVSDAESFIDGDSGSNGRRNRRRRTNSISDVSSTSTSDQSTKESVRGPKPQHGNAYLSAENLARLEEAAGEDESLAESANERDGASFHSVMSSAGQQQVMRDLEDDIVKAEAKIQSLNSKLEEARADLVTRTERRRIKIELRRAEAEYHGLQALKLDMHKLLTEDPGTAKEDEIILASRQNERARNTKAILAAKRKRDSMLEANSSHNLTRNLNPELFQGSFVIQQFKVVVHVPDEQSTLKESSTQSSPCFELVSEQAGVALIHQTQESKVFFSVDQVTMALRNMPNITTPSRVLLSCGSADSLLPSHFPHLVSRSMEEKFIRGSINMKRLHTIDAGTRRKTMKVRLIVGDMEFLPLGQLMAPLQRFAAAAGTVSKSNSDIVLRNNSGAELGTRKKNGDSDTSSSCYDVAIRITSVRIVLSCNGTIVGAAASTETSLRFVSLVSPLRNRFQIDLRSTNLQLLEISSLEAGLGSEIVGRRDPYNSLVQFRVRSQLVQPFENGGWVVGTENRGLENQTLSMAPSVRNLHLGVKINPISVVAAEEALGNIVLSTKELFSLFKQDKHRPKQEEANIKKQPSKMVQTLRQISEKYPIRWRVDMALKRVSLNFPEKKVENINFTEDVNSKMAMSFSIVCCFQQESTRRSLMAIQLALTDLTVVRSSDDWPILEPCALICDACVETNILSLLVAPGKENHFGDFPQLDLTAGSALNEIGALMHRYGWDTFPIHHAEAVQYSLVAKLTPFKANVSARVIALIFEVARSLSTMFKIEKNDLEVKRPPKGNKRFGVHVFLEEFELQVLRETEARPVAHAKPLLSFTMTDVRVDYQKSDQVTASFLIGSSSLFDLSSSRGVRALGENEVYNGENSPHFVSFKLFMDTNTSGPDTVHFDINWGRIQCLVIPSFLKSILSFKDDLQNSLKVAKPNGVTAPKEDIFNKFLGLGKDINLHMSAKADSFECIFSSKDIAEYVRQGGTEPIGVVTLRWQAALNIALALDNLQGGSVPSRTLNLDGTFTDPEDATLFKDFVNRYLSQSSGLLAGSEEIGQQLINAFTARMGLVVTDFQVIRTNISGKLLKSRTKSVSYESAHRMYFSVTPPIAGEQRVTNPIELDLVYRAVGATMADLGEPEVSLPQVEIAQLVEMKAKFVDLLLYISQSTGGFTESYRTTIKPTLDALRKQDTRRKPDVEQYVEPTGVSGLSRKRSLIDVLKSASSLCKIELEGLQITCVPGGATLLNESPILKIELNRLISGIAAVAVPIETKYSTSHGMRSRSNSQNLLAGSDLAYLTVAGWIICEISGHYHNRRLVAWEPFLEPWTADIRFGVDTVEAFKVAPFTIVQRNDLKSPNDPKNANFDAFSSTLSDGRGDRLRDFGRLFRAPFQTSMSTKQTSSAPILISHTDFCYLMLASTSRSTILSVLYPNSESQQEQEARLFSRLPAREKLDWLRGFGHPGRENDEPYALSCAISDSKPLNINLTGALLENVVGYIQSVKSSGFLTVAPHWIRNDTGMTLRFQEVLDSERAKRGEEAGKFIVLNGAEVPLTLRRSLSQTCDPHRAYIYLEVGSFEDTVGRIKHDDLDIPKGALSSSFFFKAAAKIPVDTVGVHRYPLDRNIETRSEAGGSVSNSRTFGWIIVRVALRDGVKVVSVESPFVLKSTADSDLICEIREHNGLSLLWRCLVPKASSHDKNSPAGNDLVSVPADIVPFLHDGSYTFSLLALPRTLSVKHEAELTSFGEEEKAIEIITPPPFSPQSYGKGLILEEEVTMTTLDTSREEDTASQVHVTVCSFRLGSFSGVQGAVEVPEQRMLVFRSPVAITNCLALPVAVQVRVNIQSSTEKQPGNQGLNRLYSSYAEWVDLGVLDCGESVNWTGATSSDKVQLRVRFVGIDGDNSRRFPGWSSAVYIPALDKSPQGISRPAKFGSKPFARMRVLDAESIPLHLSVAFQGGKNSGLGEPAIDENIRSFSQTLSTGTRAVAIFVPYWIVDSTNQDLEFFSGASVAGQLDKSVQFDSGRNERDDATSTLGLAELLDNENFLHIPSTRSFDVMMVGDQSTTRLTVRKRVERKTRNSLRRLASPWSDPIPLQSEGRSQHDITVLAPKSEKNENVSSADDLRGFDRFMLQSNVVSAPERFGGLVGTKLIHIVNRYSILNETGRDFEIASDFSNATVVLVRATGIPHPFHFDDSRPLRMRFKEFGWTWSGKFNIRLSRPEVTMRLHHRMKGKTLIVTVELLARQKGSTNVLVFRQSSHPPFRLENHTMFPLKFGQSSAILGSEDSDVDAMLLPYQNSDFAWDEPELRRRVLVVRATESAERPEGFTLGRFHLDRLAPGTTLHLDSSLFAGDIVADGPTRVLRITDASMPSLSKTHHDELSDFQALTNDSNFLTMSIAVKLAHGIGISVVDWSPRELLYARLEDIQIERRLDRKCDAVNLSIGNIKLNNQLWVTPYPVLLKMGRRTDSQQTIRRRHRRHDAISLSWRRSQDTHGGYGNLTLLELVELSSEPVFVNVDGQLAGLLFRMAQQMSWVRRDGNRSAAMPSRDEELRKVLELGEDISETSAASKLAKTPYHQSSDGDLMTTAAIAAKLRAQPLPFVKVVSNSRSRSSARRAASTELSKPQRKFYIEKLRISATKADLSWSGPLPGLVSSRLLRALTFERLPVRLRPYTISHSYGNVKDHLQSVKSHYVSFWRILDLILGLSYNPTFLFRAIVYTSRETCASILNSWASDAKATAKHLTELVSKGAEASPMYEGGTSTHEMQNTIRIGRAFLSPFAIGGACLMSAFSSCATFASSVLLYGSQGSKRLAQQGLVRSRNPRLFAHLDGKDLLVEYVEGENAGKALLSRVRMGMHLGEGYIYHSEGVRQRKVKSKLANDIDSSPFIVMVTSERTMMLNGKLDWNFCSVVWEAMFTNIVHLELIKANDLSLTSAYDEVIIWYLRDSLFSEGNSEERSTTYAKALVAGVDVLHSMSVFVPPNVGAQLISKMSGVDKRLAVNVNEE